MAEVGLLVVVRPGEPFPRSAKMPERQAIARILFALHFLLRLRFGVLPQAAYIKSVRRGISNLNFAFASAPAHPLEIFEKERCDSLEKLDPCGRVANRMAS